MAGDLSYRSRSVRLISTSGRFSIRAPEGLFLASAIGQLTISPGFWRGWSRSQLRDAAIFGLATTAINLFFYLEISRIDLGKSVAIEFIGPILVAAWLT